MNCSKVCIDLIKNASKYVLIQLRENDNRTTNWNVYGVAIKNTTFKTYHCS